MAGVLQHLRSSTLNKRPNPASMVDGQLAINYASGSPGAFFKDTNGNLVKVGPVHVGTTAPNVSPASGGTAGNSLGEQWLDTSGGTYVFKIWDGAAWRSEAGEFVNSTGDTMTGSLTMGPSANLIFEGSTDDGFETTLTVVDPTADRTITLPNVSGTVVTTGDSGTVTSTMIADGTIVNADVNASAAIAGTKISPDFGSQTIQTTGVFSHAVGSAGAPIITFTGDTNTGIYSPGADQVAISTGGSGRLFVDASGRVGIGASGPGFPLEVRATSSTGQVQMLGSDNTNATWRLATPSSSVVAFGGTTTHAVAFGGFDNTTQAFSERARIDSSGRLLVGTSSGVSTTALGIASLQVAGGTNETTQISISRYSGNPDRPRLAFIKSRSGTVGANTILQDGDNLGEIAFMGADGSSATGYPIAAFITAAVDGTPGANDMPGRLVFSTTADGASSPTERMRIRQDGNVLFGKTSFDFSVAGIQTEASSTSLTITRTSGDALTLRRNTDNGDIVSFYRDGTKVGSISVTTSATAYNTSSDYRLKENVVSVTDGITRLQQLKPSRFNFIADPSKTVDGFIAHEVQTVVPEAISGEKDAVDDEGNPQYQGIDQSKLVPLLTAALQEAIGEIESLKARVAALEGA